MTYKKPQPIPVQVMTPELAAPGFLHNTVAGKAIVEVMHGQRGGHFITVLPHQVKSRSHEEWLRQQLQESAA